MQSYTHTLRTRFADTDAMGIVHHARYFEYFEAARVAMLAAQGLSYPSIMAMGYHLPLISAQVQYKAPAKFDEELSIETQLQPLEGLRLPITYQIRRGTQLLAQGTTTHVFIDTQHKPVRPPKEFLQIIGA